MQVPVPLQMPLPDLISWLFSSSEITGLSEEIIDLIYCLGQAQKIENPILI